MMRRELERPDLNPSNVPEALSLNGEVVFSKELTLGKLAELTKNDEMSVMGFDFDNVRFVFEVQDLGDSFLNIASFSGQHPLDSENFLFLLSEAKPGGLSRMGQGVLGIKADWDIILPEVRAVNPRKQALYDHHKENVPGFSEFEENHFQKFWNAINSTPARTIKKEEDNFFSQQATRFIAEEDLFLRYGKDFFTADPRGLQRMHGSYKFRDLTIRFLNEKGYNDFANLKDEPAKFIERLESLFESRLSKSDSKQFQAEWYSYIVSRLGERQLALDATRVSFSAGDLIVVDKNGNLYDIFMTLDSSLDPSGYKIQDWSLLGADAIEKLNNGEIKVSKGRAHMIVGFVVDERGIRRRVTKEVQYSPNPLTYPSPVVIWKRDKNTNQASFFCGQIPQELTRSRPDLFSERHDTLLGQLTVAAYSPKVRNQMRKEVRMIGTDGKEKIQQMLEAQSVLLVPQYDQLFLNESPVILGLEEMAKRK